MAQAQAGTAEERPPHPDHQQPTDSDDHPAGRTDATQYQHLQQVGGQLTDLLAEAERRARAAGETSAATGYLRQWATVDEQRRHTHPADHDTHQHLLTDWSTRTARLRNRLTQ